VPILVAINGSILPQSFRNVPIKFLSNCIDRRPTRFVANQPMLFRALTKQTNDLAIWILTDFASRDADRALSDCDRGVKFPEFAAAIQSRHQRPDILVYRRMAHGDHENLKKNKGSKPATKGDEKPPIDANNADFPKLDAVRARARGPL
jgi:hypothetical protein